MISLSLIFFGDFVHEVEGSMYRDNEVVFVQLLAEHDLFWIGFV